MSESVAKAPRAGIGREKKRGISTILLARSSAIEAFATDLDNRRRQGPSPGTAAAWTAAVRALEYAAIVAGKSPQAIRMLKLAFNLADDDLAGQQVFAGEATRLAHMTDEAVEGRDAFLQRRAPDWSPFPYYF